MVNQPLANRGSSQNILARELSFLVLTMSLVLLDPLLRCERIHEFWMAQAMLTEYLGGSLGCFSDLFQVWNLLHCLRASVLVGIDIPRLNPRWWLFIPFGQKFVHGFLIIKSKVHWVKKAAFTLPLVLIQTRLALPLVLACSLGFLNLLGSWLACAAGALLGGGLRLGGPTGP